MRCAGGLGAVAARSLCCPEFNLGKVGLNHGHRWGLEGPFFLCRAASRGKLRWCSCGVSGLHGGWWAYGWHDGLLRWLRLSDRLEDWLVEGVSAAALILVEWSVGRLVDWRDVCSCVNSGIRKNWIVDWSGDWLFDRSGDWCNWLVGWSITWLMWLVGWLIDQVTDVTGWLVDRSGDWCNWLVGWSIRWLM